MAVQHKLEPGSGGEQALRAEKEHRAPTPRGMLTKVGLEKLSAPSRCWGCHQPPPNLLFSPG